MEHYYLIIFILAAIGFIAGVIDTLAGGGGLITVPTLLAAGLPPALALGTNKLQACVGEVNASIYFIRQKQLNFKEIVQGLIFAGIGAILGTILIQAIHENVARQIIPWLLLVVLLYTLFSPSINKLNLTKSISSRLFYPVFGLLIGFYNGFFGPGTGAIWVFAFMFFLRFNIAKATIYTKPLNFIGNLLSLSLFIVGGNVNYPFAIAMGMGQFLGARLGAKMVVAKGSTLIRPLYILMVSIMMVGLFLKRSLF